MLKAAIAEVTELHAHVHEGDVMRMVKVDSIEIPAHSDLTLEPGGYHIMLIDLHKPLSCRPDFASNFAL